MFFIKQRYICIKQHDIKDCGAACLATIAKHYGLKVPISKIREYAGTDINGTNVKGLIQGAKMLGFTAKGVRATTEALFQKFPLPAIAHVIVNNSLLHYVVIHKITNTQVIIADPAEGLKKMSLEEFFQIWTGVLVLLVPAPAFEKGDQTKGLFQRFIGLLKPHRGILLQIFFASILFTALGIIGSFYFQFLIDDILTQNLEKSLHVLSIGIILLYTFKVLLNAFRTYLLIHLSQKLDLGLVLGYYHHVLSLPMNFFSTRKVGEIISRLMDASKVRDAVSGATLTIMIDTLMVIVGGIVLYAQNSFLFGVTVLLVPLYTLIMWAFHKPFQIINRREMEDNAQLTSYIVESINGIETVKAYNAEEQAKFNTEKKFIAFLKSAFSNDMINNFQSSLKMCLELIGGVAILWVGANEVLKGNMSIGQLIAYNALLAYFLEPIQNLINLQPMIQSAVVASERLGEILDLETEKAIDEERKVNVESLKGDILIKDLEFRYGTREPVLKNINIHIRQGEKIALVGESGSGKTTLIKLLMRFYNYEKGDILVNDINIRDINLDQLRKKIAYIPQENFFFSGTIQENLCLGMENDVQLEDIIHAAKIPHAHEFINKLPLRYNTILEENASNLSGGQRQRLAIARAILKKPDILIMDEATSNLDSTTEKAISETIHEFGRDIITIIIAHRLSTIMGCDKIYVMDHGQIIESGTHQELMELRGKYYELWKDQLPSEYEQLSNHSVVTG